MCDVSIAWAGPVQRIRNVNGRAKQLPVNMSRLCSALILPIFILLYTTSRLFSEWGVMILVLNPAARCASDTFPPKDQVFQLCDVSWPA
jgi:hypothetical protein